MISPNFLSLPIFPDLNFVYFLVFSHIFKVLLTDWHGAAASIPSIVEKVLTPAYILMSFEFPQYCSSIISSTCEE
jgi:hypothetical protein